MKLPEGYVTVAGGAVAFIFTFGVTYGTLANDIESNARSIDKSEAHYEELKDTIHSLDNRLGRLEERLDASIAASSRAQEVTQSGLNDIKTLLIENQQP